MKENWVRQFKNRNTETNALRLFPGYSNDNYISHKNGSSMSNPKESHHNFLRTFLKEQRHLGIWFYHLSMSFSNIWVWTLSAEWSPQKSTTHTYSNKLQLCGVNNSTIVLDSESGKPASREPIRQVIEITIISAILITVLNPTSWGNAHQKNTKKPQIRKAKKNPDNKKSFYEHWTSQADPFIFSYDSGSSNMLIGKVNMESTAFTNKFLNLQIL